MQTLPYGLNEKFLKKEFVKKLLLEGLDGGGGYKCQLSVKISAIYQLPVKFLAICQLSVK